MQIQKIAFLTAILLLISLLAEAQRFGPEGDPEGKSKAEEPPAARDTVKTRIKKWQLRADISQADTAVIDTTLRKLDIFRKVYQKSVFNYYLGNIGLGALPMHYFDRPYRTDYLLSRYHAPYLQRAENMFFFNTNTPYTVLKYTTSTRARDKQTIDALHTQNVNPALNFAVNIGGHKSEGAYNRQNSSKSYYRTTVNYLKKHYVLHAAFSHTRLDNMENGGMTLDLSDPEDPLLTPNLNSANTSHFMQSAMLAQTYKIGNRSNIPDTINQGIRDSWLDISHKFTMNRQAYLYKEKEASVDEYYQTLYYDTTATFDSTYHGSFKNNLQLRFSEDWNSFFPLGILIGIEHEYEKFYNFRDPLETKAEYPYNNLKVQAKAFNRVSKRYGWSGEASYYLSGYHENDWMLKGRINLQLLENTFPLHLEAKAVFKEFTPAFFKKRYYSNHAIWDKNLKKESQQLIGASLHMPQINTRISLNTERHEHYTYFDSTATPQQYGNPLSVLSIELEQTFQAGHFHYDHRAFWQRSDANKILQIGRASCRERV